MTTDLANRIRGHLGANQITSATPFIAPKPDMKDNPYFKYITILPISFIGMSKDFLIPLEQLVILDFHCTVNKNLICTGGGRTKHVYVYLKDQDAQNIILVHIFPSITSAQSSLFTHQGNASVISNIISHSGILRGG